jgi:hypothetical protein
MGTMLWPVKTMRLLGFSSPVTKSHQHKHYERTRSNAICHTGSPHNALHKIAAVLLQATLVYDLFI